jgi:hypothetical protein
MGRLEKMKRLIIEQANMRILGEQQTENNDIESKLSLDPKCKSTFDNIGKSLCKVLNSKELLGLDNVELFKNSTSSYLLFPNMPTKYKFIKYNTDYFYPSFALGDVSFDYLVNFVNWVKGGNIPLSEVDEDSKEGYEIYLNNPLKGYDVYISQIRYDIEYGCTITVTCMAKDQNQSVKKIIFGGDTGRRGYAKVYMHGENHNVSKPYRIENGEIFFDGDDKTTKGLKRATGNEQLLSIALNDDWEGISMGKEKYVNIGTRGSVVKEIQHKLLNSGLSNNFNLTNNINGCKKSVQYCDGIFGKGTKKAVEEFQKTYDLVVDGLVGPDTARALKYINI